MCMAVSADETSHRIAGWEKTGLNDRDRQNRSLSVCLIIVLFVCVLVCLSAHCRFQIFWFNSHHSATVGPLSEALKAELPYMYFIISAHFFRVSPVYTEL